MIVSTPVLATSHRLVMDTRVLVVTTKWLVKIVELLATIILVTGMVILPITAVTMGMITGELD